MKNIAFYAIGDESLPSTWFRVIQYLPGLHEAGFSVSHYVLPPARGGRFAQFAGLLSQAKLRRRQLQEAKNYDLLIIQKGLTFWRAKGLAEILLSTQKPFLMDLDDSVPAEAPIQFPGLLGRLQDHGDVFKLLRKASGVLAGNPYLAEFAGRFNSHVMQLPTPIDTEKYTLQPKAEKERIVIGWSGSAATNIYVDSMIPVLNALAPKYRFEFLMISNNMNKISVSKMKFRWRFVEWKKELEVRDLSEMDIGLMPLQQDFWSPGKCGLKALQYMALGIPAICSPVGVNCDIVKDGINGFLASGEDDWKMKIERLIQDFPLRTRIGAEGRKTVEDRYSVRANLPKLVEILNGVVEGSGVLR